MSPQNTNDKSRYVCIVGYPRSGTTLVYHLLMSSTEFAFFPFDETHYFSHFYKMYGDLGDSENFRRLLSDLNKSGVLNDVAGFEKSVFEQAKDQKITYESVFRYLMKHLAMSHGKRSWVEKTPWHMLYLKEIQRAVSSVKIVLLVRDPRAVALSIDKAGWSPKSDILHFASGWKWHMSYTERLIGNLNIEVMTVKYEDVVFETEKTLKRINTFLKIDLNINDVLNKKAGVLRKGNSSFGNDEKQSLYTASVHHWRKCLAPSDQGQINYLLRNYLKKYDYEAFDAGKISNFLKLKVRVYYSIYSVLKSVKHLVIIRRMLRRAGS